MSDAAREPDTHLFYTDAIDVAWIQGVKYSQMSIPLTATREAPKWSK